MSKNNKKTAAVRTAIVPGSFDPMTVGHLDVVKRALALFDRVAVAVMNNPEKEYMFTPAERLRIAELTVAGFERVFVISSDGLTAELYASLGACALVKGIRNGGELSYELMQADFNSQRPERCETIFLPASPGMRRISSTSVRRSIEKGRVPEKLLAPDAAVYIKSIAGKKAGKGKNNEE